MKNRKNKEKAIRDKVVFENFISLAKRRCGDGWLGWGTGALVIFMVILNDTQK